MNASIKTWIFALVFGFAIIASQTTGSAAPWVSAYYCSWTLTSPAPANLDLRAVTHLMFFALKPNADGTLGDPNGTMSSNASAVKAAAHNAGRKVLICVGGGGSAAQFEGAVSPSNQAAFVHNIAAWVIVNGYDGVDIDMEPISMTDGPAFQSFIRALRGALAPPYLITAAAEPDGDPGIFSPIQNDLDQINVMTYDLSGLRPGWLSWYNSNLYTAGATLPSNGHSMPSCDLIVQRYINGGIAPAKLAIAAAFYGTMWTGVSAPMQGITGASTDNVTYEQIVDKYYNSANFFWDPNAHAAYLSLQSGGVNQFISFDNEQLCEEKVKYVVSKGLGGLMCWNIGQQYFPNQPYQQQNPLLTAVFTALKTSP